MGFTHSRPINASPGRLLSDPRDAPAVKFTLHDLIKQHACFTLPRALKWEHSLFLRPHSRCLNPPAVFRNWRSIEYTINYLTVFVSHYDGYFGTRLGQAGLQGQTYSTAYVGQLHYRCHQAVFCHYNLTRAAA